MTASERQRIANDWIAVLLLLGVGASLLWLLPKILGGMSLASFATPIRTILILALATWLLHRSGEGWAHVGLRRPAAFRRAFGVIVGGYVLIALVGTVLIGLVFPALGWPNLTTDAFTTLRGDVRMLLYWLLIAWTCAAFGEELIFRGFLLTRMERLFGGGRTALMIALLAQAMIFGLSHAYQGPSGMALTGVTGFILGCAYLVSGRNLVVVILLHGLVDTVSLTALYSGVL